MTYQITDDCGVFVGFLQSGNFFEGLQRKETKLGVKFHKGNQTVQEFPDQVSVRLEVLPTACPRPATPVLLGRLPGKAPATDPTTFMNGWKFTAAWVDEGQVKTIANVGLMTRSAEKVVFAEQDRAPWTYTLTLPLKGVSLTARLLISVVSDNGTAMTTISVGL